METEPGWRKPTYSNPNGACFEIGRYRKSSHSQGASNCIEAGTGPMVVGVRDTKQAHLGDRRTVLEFSTAAWGTFLGAVRDGTALA